MTLTPKAFGSIKGVSKTSRVRWAGAAALAAFAMLLAGCSSNPDPSPTPSASPSAPSATPNPNAQKNLDAITVSNTAFGREPKITIKKPYYVDQTRSKVLKQGGGPAVGPNAIVDVHYVGVNGRDNAKFDSSYPTKKSVPFPLDQVIPGFSKGLQGHKAGSRVLIAMPGPDAYDQAIAVGYGPKGMKVGDTLVFVVDIVSVSTTGPYGTPVTPPAHLPKVTDDQGKPVVTIDSTKPAPAANVVQPLMKGTGPKVGATHSIQAHYRTWSWKTGKMIEDKYGAVDSGAIANTIPCWKAGIIGQTAGSRIMLICTPESSYPNGANNPPVTKGDTLVYVVDILFTTTEPLS